MRDCFALAYAWYRFRVNIVNLTNNDRSTIDRAARICASVSAFTRSPSCMYEPTLTPTSGAPAKKKTFVGKTNLAGVPDDRWNSSVSIRMRCVIVLRWPMPGTSFG